MSSKYNIQYIKRDLSVATLHSILTKKLYEISNITDTTKHNTRIEDIVYLDKEKKLCFKYCYNKNSEYLLIKQKDIENILNIEIISITNPKEITTKDILEYIVTYKSEFLII